jgi:hypothetical protein
MDKLGDHTTNPVFYTSGNRFVRRTSMFGNPNTNLIVFGLTRPGLELTIYRTQQASTLTYVRYQ